MILVALLAVALATFLILGYVLFIWWLDRYEREPIWLVGLTFLWGGLGGTCLSCVINSSIGAGAAQARSIAADRDGLESFLRGWFQIWDLRLPVIAKVHGYLNWKVII